MPFQALTGAPRLRDGVTLNIMPYPQAEGTPPERLSPGAHITLRLGHCCPTVTHAHVSSVEDDPARVVLVLDGATWTLEPVAEGVAIAGIVSENWIVRGG